MNKKVLQRLREKAKEFDHILYSPVKNTIILLCYKQLVLVRKNKPNHRYFEYADENLWGKYISNKNLARDGYKYIGEF